MKYKISRIRPNFHRATNTTMRINIIPGIHGYPPKVQPGHRLFRYHCRRLWLLSRRRVKFMFRIRRSVRESAKFASSDRPFYAAHFDLFAKARLLRTMQRLQQGPLNFTAVSYDAVVWQAQGGRRPQFGFMYSFSSIRSSSLPTRMFSLSFSRGMR